MIQKTTEACGTVAATCTLGAYIMDALPEIAAVLSVVWLSINIVWFVWTRVKEWRAKK